jgi:hypothetical protein
VSTEAVSTASCPIAPRATKSPNYNPRTLGGNSIVPYVSAWSGEKPTQPPVVRRRLRIEYAQEMPIDRDEWGVLWARRASLIGAGRPLFGKMHPARQRLAMLRMLCQICARPADHTEEGSLWLLPAQPRYEPDWLDYAPITTPPLCIECAQLSVHKCPWLRQGYVAVRAHSRICGVSGARLGPGRLAEPETDDDDLFYYGDPSTRWVLAVHQTRLLYSYRFVGLDQLADAHASSDVKVHGEQS